MKMVPVNFPVLLFLVAILYLALMVNTSFWVFACSNPFVPWNTCRFSSYWCFSYYWACQVAAIGMMICPGCT